MSLDKFSEQFTSAYNWSIGGVIAASAFSLGLILTPGLFFEIPYHSGKFNIKGSLFRKGEKYPYGAFVILSHLILLAALMFIISIFAVPGFIASNQ